MGRFIASLNAKTISPNLPRAAPTPRTLCSSSPHYMSLPRLIQEGGTRLNSNQTEPPSTMGLGHVPNIQELHSLETEEG
jgi:hypothetical protein